MDSTCIEKNTVSGIRLIGQKYQAKLVLEPAKLLGAWRHCLHASADSRTGVMGQKKKKIDQFFQVGKPNLMRNLITFQLFSPNDRW